MLTFASFNLCNLGAQTPCKRLQKLAVIIAQELHGPDILGVQEIMAATATPGPVPADEAYCRLITAIAAAGGPRYDFREIPPLANCDGGLAGANIRVGLLFNPQRVQFVNRGGGAAEDATRVAIVSGHPVLTLSPGRIDPSAPAFAGDLHRHWVPSRKALTGEFHFAGNTVFFILCHLKSMRAVSRREQDYTKKQRHAQAEIIHRFVADIMACDPQANIVVLGDMNDLPGSKTLQILKGRLLNNLLESIPKKSRYTRRHGGQPQALDHILVSEPLRRGAQLRIPHVNSDLMSQDRPSDHDPVVAAVEL
jgi:predicted extracellular nuclease